VAEGSRPLISRPNVHTVELIRLKSGYASAVDLVKPFDADDLSIIVVTQPFPSPTLRREEPFPTHSTQDDADVGPPT
jgi:hypothetical protein